MCTSSFDVVEQNHYFLPLVHMGNIAVKLDAVLECLVSQEVREIKAPYFSFSLAADANVAHQQRIS
jgi:hypothetical protein